MLTHVSMAVAEAVAEAAAELTERSRPSLRRVLPSQLLVQKNRKKLK